LKLSRSRFRLALAFRAFVFFDGGMTCRILLLLLLVTLLVPTGCASSSDTEDTPVGWDVSHSKEDDGHGWGANIQQAQGK
jgi:hypothetical protein